ncbi:MAG: molybdopterin-dependent oxidoreductase [Pseudomonadota bacterium]
MSDENSERPRIPPGQRVTEKFPVMTAGAPDVTPAARWTLTLEREAEDMSVETLAVWDMATFRALGLARDQVDLHCVTRWSKLDTKWRGVRIDRLLDAAGVASPQERYLQAHCDGDYAANLKLEDLRGEGAMIALDYNDGTGFSPIPLDHGGPARLLVPALYLWKSAKWVRRLTLSPYDRKGFWEKLGYHNYGDPWREQRYRGISDDDHRRTLDTDLSRRIREERLGEKKDDPN